MDEKEQEGPPLDLNAEIEQRRAKYVDEIIRRRIGIDNARERIKELQSLIAALPRPPIKRVRKASK